jgi:hypothetical protein
VSSSDGEGNVFFNATFLFTVDWMAACFSPNIQKQEKWGRIGTHRFFLQKNTVNQQPTVDWLWFL